MTFLAESARPAGRDARDEYAVSGLHRRHRGPDLDDRPDRLMTEDRARLHLGNIALEDVQVGAADGRGVDADDCVRRLLDHRVGHVLPRADAGPAVDETFHGYLLVARRAVLATEGVAESVGARIGARRTTQPAACGRAARRATAPHGRRRSR